jgi:hypothetical protein
MGTLTAVTAACSLFTSSSPSITGTYVLSRVDGTPLPAVIDRFRTIDGRVFEMFVLRGTMRFESTGIFIQRNEVRRAINGVPGDSILPGLIMGRYRKTDTGIVVLRFLHIVERTPHVLVYRIAEGGRVLIGFQDYRLHEWVRE